MTQLLTKNSEHQGCDDPGYGGDLGGMRVVDLSERPIINELPPSLFVPGKDGMSSNKTTTEEMYEREYGSREAQRWQPVDRMEREFKSRSRN